MSINKRIIAMTIFTLILGFSAIFLFPKEQTIIKAENHLRIGAGDDTTGLLLNYIMKISEEMETPSIVTDRDASLDALQFKDCCTNTSQWALTTDEIDMAFYCNHIALHLVNTNDRFVIYGPVIMNSEVIAYEGDIAAIQTLGIGQRRGHIQKLTQEAYPQVEEIREMNTGILPYSLENKQIDAAVIDVTKAVLLPKFSFLPIAKHDYISYCLVVRKDLIGTEIFEDFVIIYNQAIDELNLSETLISSMGMTKEFWDIVNIKFLKL